MHAIVEISGKQYAVEQGRYIVIDQFAAMPDDAVTIPNVLMIVDGDTSVVGTPYIEGAQVSGKVLTHFRGPKVLVYKMRCKKGYRRKNGHRQEHTRLMVDSIVWPGGSSATASAATAEKPQKAPAAKKKAAAE